jgi:mannose-6-phosphate isomerase-like protein (cupin superfamily)
MSSNWRPDDSFLDTEKDGEQAGVRRIRHVLREHGFELGQILTSRDKGMEAVVNELKRSHLPPGIQQWQLPVAVGGTFAFRTVAESDAVIPEHSHRANLFRVVVSGTAIYRDAELKTGDWMLVPKGEPYSLRAASNRGFTTDHMYW